MVFARARVRATNTSLRAAGAGGRGAARRDARALLDATIPGPLDERVRDRILAEARGNPLALLELPRGLTLAELAGGFGLPDATPLTSRIEQGFVRQLEPFPFDTRRLLLLAAAEPVGDVTLLWRAADQLGIEPEAAVPAQAAGLFEIGARVRFRHPLVRSAAYRAAACSRDREVHRALAEATDPQLDPDRRAWHRAHAAEGPTRRWPASWNGRPTGPRRAAALPRPPRSWSMRRN